MRTRATRHGDGYLLNGAKMWITNGTVADVAVVWAKLDDTIRGFLVERGTPGFSAPEMKGKHSLRASVTSELVFQDVVVPATSMLAHAEGLRAPLSCLSQARYGIAWGALGAAMACYDAALAYARTRIQFDKPIASFSSRRRSWSRCCPRSPKRSCSAFNSGALKMPARRGFSKFPSPSATT